MLRVTVTVLLIVLTTMPAPGQIKLSKISSYPAAPVAAAFNQSASEIAAYDAATHRLFVVNGKDDRIDIVDISNPAVPVLFGSVGVGGNPNSVASRDGVVAVAVEAAVKTDPGKVKFYDTDGVFLKEVTVGALPDMVAFTPNGRRVLVANEGEPNDAYTVDPEGSVSIIDMTVGVANLTSANVATAGFAAFNGAVLDPSIRIFGPGATVAKDLEPEFITFSHDSKTAWVTLQENNAIAVVDIESATVTQLLGLGFKNHLLTPNKLDASDSDGAINIANWPVFGMFQPDAIDSYRVGGVTYLVTANEGDSRDYAGFSEEKRVNQLTLDPTAFPTGATLKLNANLGRLRVTNKLGDTDGDGDFDQLYAFGARSFSIRTTSGALVYDSKDDFEQKTAVAFPANFNSNHEANNFDNRSDDKGPEPEGLVIGKAFGRTYAFIALERIGGVMVYDISDPTSPSFVRYVNPRPFTGSPAAGTAGDLGPEGMVFIKEEDSPNGNPLLVVCNEVSGTTVIFEITKDK